MEQIPEEKDSLLDANIVAPHEIQSHASKLKMKAKQINSLSSPDLIPPEEAIKNIQKNLLHPYQLDEVKEEDEIVGGAISSPDYPYQDPASAQ